MKLIVKTKTTVARKTTKHTYFVHLPNYFDTEQTADLVEDISKTCLKNEKIVEHMLMGDAHITNDERKQLDIYGEIVDAPVELQYNLREFQTR